MIALRLFSRDDAGRQLDMRVLGDREEITLGRDAGAGWTLSDPDRALSRQHLTVAVRGGTVSVTDTSTNGVTSPGRTGRFPKDQSVRVDPGERLELGPYVLLIERSEREPTSAALGPELRGGGGGGNPFAPMGAAQPDEPRRPALDPFASRLKPDPLAPDAFAEEDDGFRGGGGLIGRDAGPAAGGAGLLDGDAWQRRSARGAGDWNGAPAREEPMIGAPGPWIDPPAAPADDKGFGFDAPFRQPILRTPDLRAGDLAIPSDWDRAPAAEPPPEPSAASPPATSPFAQTHGAPDDVAPGRDAQAEPAPVESAEDERLVDRSPPPRPPEERTDPPRPSAAPPARGREAEARPPSTPPRAEAGGGGELLAAFYRGARLDGASLAGEDPAALMERLGVIYRQMVLGLSDVLGERTALKNEYRMVRTTIQPDENNPFKWAPAQKVAVELLRSTHDGYLDGPAAVADSYGDVKKHLLCMLAGLRAALGSSLDALAPERMEEAVKDQASVLKPRAQLAWAEYLRVYAQFRREAEDSADGQVNREFRAAYEKQLDELDRMALR